VLALLLVAPLLSVDNFAAAASMGLAGWRVRTCLKVCAVFGAYAAAALTFGLTLGMSFASDFDSKAPSLGGAILVLVSVVRLLDLLRHPAAPDQVSAGHSVRSLASIGLGVSLDTAAAGVGLGLFGVPVVGAIAVITLVTVSMTFAGFRMASLVTSGLGGYGERWAAVALLLVGFGLIAHII
jgi:putative Mn2+ efflux pump MntP